MADLMPEDFCVADFTDAVPNPLGWRFTGWNIDDHDEYTGKVIIERANIIGYKNTGQRSIVNGADVQHHIVIASSPDCVVKDWKLNELGGLVAKTESPVGHATRQIHLEFLDGYNVKEKCAELADGASRKAEINLFGKVKWITFDTDLFAFQGFGIGIQCPCVVLHNCYVEPDESNKKIFKILAIIVGVIVSLGVLVSLIR